MAYKRQLEPARLLTGDELTRAMVGIGMVFTAEPLAQPNIEDTLLAASVEGMVTDDLRVLSVLITWLSVHHSWVNADRLVRLVLGYPEPRVRALWSAVAEWLSADRRFARLLNRQEARVPLLRVGSAFQVRRRGEDLRFQATGLCVPAGVLRDRSEDVLSPRELAKRHAAYRYRVLMGPSYRADMWALLEAEPTLPPAELARRSYGSFATAWQVKKDFLTLVA